MNKPHCPVNGNSEHRPIEGIDLPLRVIDMVPGQESEVSKAKVLGSTRVCQDCRVFYFVEREEPVIAQASN